MYQKILQNPLVFGDEIGSQARSILTGLLTRDPTQRLGVNGADEIKKHPFFAKNIDFDKLLAKKIQPPFKPSVASPVVSTLMLLDMHCTEKPCRMCQTLTPSSQLKLPWTVWWKVLSCRKQSRTSLQVCFPFKPNHESMC